MDLPYRARSKSPGVDSISSGLPTRSQTSSSSPFTPPPLSSDGRTPDSRPAQSYFRRRFSSVWLEKRQTTIEEPGAARGPLGLRLLHASPEPLIDLIFVHGLRGGSYKTWRKGDDPRFFWPQCWLPVEPGFRNANIHSFGYDSDWGSTKPSILNVHDFGRSLYEGIRASPQLRAASSSRGPIILIGHSMGGLVIKKTYVLAHQDRASCDVSSRIRCMFFLATPHRGSDYALILNRILKVSGIMSSRDYIDDLMTGSTSTELIHDEFGRCADELAIYSFYETLPTSLGMSASLIVEKGSAILGHKNERIQYLSANHRDICKFESLDDSNYVTLKNALATATHDLLKDIYIGNEEAARKQLLAIHSFLGVGSSELADETYERQEGSCQWIEERDDFKTWRDAPHDMNKGGKIELQPPSVYWVTANPGAGKTFLATHIIAQLREFRLEHAYYYFHIGNKSSQSLAASLRSLAYQMAKSSSSIREALVGLEEGGTNFDRDDARSVWLKIFQAGIFQTALFTPQYWILDALDECSKYPEFFSLLKGTRTRFPLRIFLTSRKFPEALKLQRQLEGSQLWTIEIPHDATALDIGLYVRSRIDLLPIDHADDRLALKEKIVARSGTSFLWARLVLDELEGVWSYESMQEVLEGIPNGMVPYYERTVREMTENRREKHIAQAILRWVALAARPLSTAEISLALKLDINAVLPSAKAAIEALCGHLVFVDRQTDQVHIVHSTAREFLLSEAAGEFKISKSRGHEQIAMTCLKLLCGPEMQPPRHKRLLGLKRPARQASILLSYAIFQFSEHVFGSSAEKDDILVALDKFLSTTVLSWVEKVAAEKDLHQIIGTARNLKSYLDRRAKYRSPLNRQVNNVDRWATDIGRLATRFGTALMVNPQSIYFLIPPLCPTGSAVYQLFGRSADGLALFGFDNSEWDDCAATINFDGDTTASAACGNKLIAVGFESGNTHLFDHTSYERVQVLNDKFSADLIYFHPLRYLLVTCSRKFITLWDITSGATMWKKKLRTRQLTLATTETHIVGVSQQGRVTRWDIETGNVTDEQAFAFQDIEHDSGPGTIRAPSTAAISPTLEVLALGYRTGQVCLFNLQDAGFLGWALDEHGATPAHLVFNPNPDLFLLLVAYNDSHMALYDSWSGILLHCYEHESHVLPTAVTCSPDGRTLASVDTLGNLRIWDFESLSVLYQLTVPTAPFRLLEFAPDSLSLLDVVGLEMKAWSPSVLVRKTVEDETASTSEPALQLPVAQGQHSGLVQMSRVKAAVAHPSLPIVLLGRQSGEVSIEAYGPKQDGLWTTKCSFHESVAVRHLAIGQSGRLVASSDVHSTICIWEMPEPATGEDDGSSQEAKFKARLHFTEPISQLLFNEAGTVLLASGRDGDVFFDADKGARLGVRPAGRQDTGFFRWLIMPGHGNNPERYFGLLEGDHLSLFPAGGPLALHAQSRFHLEYDLGEDLNGVHLDAAIFHPETSTLIIQVAQQTGFIHHSTTFFFNLDISSPGDGDFASPIKPIGKLTGVGGDGLVGINYADERLLLVRDSWIMSLSLKGLSHGDSQCIRHFFVPDEFTASSRGLPPAILGNDGDIIFLLHDKYAVVRNGLKFQEQVSLPELTDV